ncbi:adenylate/guanylate cyclase domain-containing protein [archaeon]|nr:MAG: adenylate/guanylate cyclase domain-containing protein [archaeon]
MIAFAGDALICVFVNKTSFLSDDCKDLANVDAGFRALHCANILRTVQFGDLSTHIGVSYGELYLAFLGGHNGQWVYLLNGQPVPLLSSCVEDALPHTVVVTEGFHSHIMKFDNGTSENRIRLPKIEFAQLPSGNFLLTSMEKCQDMISMLNDVGRLESFSKAPRGSSKKHTFVSKNSPSKKVLKKVSRSTSIRNISLDDINNLSPVNGPGSLSMSADTSFMIQQNNNPDRLLVDALVLFLPLPITLALHTEGNHMISELRHVTTLFMSLDSYDPAVHSDPVSLQPMFLAAQQVLAESGGFLRQFLVDDKGCVFIAMWGVPSYTYSNNSSRALYFAAASSMRLTELGHRCSIGITTGTVFCGTIGAIERCDYAGIGTEVNLAARFMAKAKGKIFLDENTYDNLNVANKELLVQVAEPLQLKGMPAPIQPFYYSSSSMPNLTSIDNTSNTNRNSKRTKVLRKKTMIMLEKELDKVASMGVNNMSPSVFRQSLIRAPRNVSTKGRSVTLCNVHCVILCGPPGSGKNTAAEYFRMSARDRHIPVVDIKLQAVQRTIPYECIRELFLELVGSDNFKTSEQQTKVLDELIEKAYGEESETVKKSAKRSIETILGLHRSSSPESKSNPSSPGDSRVSPPKLRGRHPIVGDDVVLSSYGDFEETRESLVGHNNARDKSDFSFYKVISSILRSYPTALVIENAHCCDELSWNELLLLMARGDFDMSILLMMKTNASHRLRSTSYSMGSPGHSHLRSSSNASSTSNPSINGDKSMSFLLDMDNDVLVTVGLDQIAFPSFNAIAKHPNTSIIEMKALNEEEVRSLLVHTLNTENVSSNLVSFVYTVSSGNPYWCKTIVQFVQEHGLDQLEDTLQASKHNHYSNQHSLKVLVLLRVEALSAWHQKVLKYASVLGLEFEVDILEAIIPASSLSNNTKEGGSHQSFKSTRKMLVAALEALEKNGFLMCINEVPDAIYGFQNDLIQRVIYELIPPRYVFNVYL